MSTVLIFGGSGKVARRLTTILTNSNPPYKVHSIIRKAEQTASIESLGATAHIHSIEDTTVPSLTELIRSLSPQAIVWSAGAGGGDPSRTEKVDREGAISAFDAAAAAGVKRFIAVSAVDVRDRENKPVPEWYDAEDKKKSDGMWDALGAFMAAKLAADHDMVTGGSSKRNLDWTIVRPSTLTEDEGTGKIEAGRVGISSKISRDDVAAVVAECLKNEKTIGLAFNVVGGQTTIKDAVDKVVQDKADCFEGYH